MVSASEIMSTFHSNHNNNTAATTTTLTSFNHRTKDDEAHQQQQQQQQPVFTCNLSCVLNDPKKTRYESGNFFTKTWGNTFVEKSPEPLSRIRDYTLSDFESYLTSLRNSDKYGRPRITVPQQVARHRKSDPTISPPGATLALSNIPTIFLSSNFSLNDSNTFNLVFPGIGHFQRSLSPIEQPPPQQQKSRTTSTSSNTSETSTATTPTKKSTSNNRSSVTSNGTTITTNQHHQKQSISSTSRVLQDKYTHYLDEIEVQICRQLSSKSNIFLDAVKSHDEIHKFLIQTRQAISSLRQELTTHDETSILTLLKLYRYMRQRQNQYLILKKLRSLTTVKQTQITVRSLLTTSDYVSALDLILVTREIIQTELHDLHCLRYCDQQLNELNILIISMMRQEFGQYLQDELKRDTTDIIDEDKFSAILVGLIRVKDDKYLDEIISKFELFIQQTIDKARREKLDETKQKQNRNSDSPDQPLPSTPDFRYTYPTHNNSYHFSQWKSIIEHILHESQLTIERINSFVNLILDIFQKCLQSKSPDEYHQLKSKYIQQLHVLYDSIQDRLIKLFNDLTTKQQQKSPLLFERLSISDFSTIVHIIQTYTLIFEQSTILSYRSQPFRTWLQSQTLKFIQHFHDERKQQINSILDTEQWKQVQVPRPLQILVDHIQLNGFTNIDQLSSTTTNTTTSTTSNEHVLIQNETFLLPNCGLKLFTIIIDYCQCSTILYTHTPKYVISDIQHRLIEILNIFNSKTCQLVLGAGAVKLGKIKTISAKILALTSRCLQFIQYFLPKIKQHFDTLQQLSTNNELTMPSSHSSSTISFLSSNKQFEQLTKLYNDHIHEIHQKLLTIIEQTFDETLSTYEVRAPVPSDCFRTLTTRHILSFYNAINLIVSHADLQYLFTCLNQIFKRLLAKRLKQLKIVNDGGPQHGLLTRDLLFYIKQIQNLEGLQTLELHTDEIWGNTTTMSNGTDK